MSNEFLKEFCNNIPIYIQIVDDIKIMIISKKLNPGDKIKSVREFAELYNVNPNTIQRAFSELERENLVFSKRTSGRYVTSDNSLIESLKTNLANSEIKRFIDSMQRMGFNKDDIIESIKNIIEESE